MPFEGGRGFPIWNGSGSDAGVYGGGNRAARARYRFLARMMQPLKIAADDTVAGCCAFQFVAVDARDFYRYPLQGSWCDPYQKTQQK